MSNQYTRGPWRYLPDRALSRVESIDWHIAHVSFAGGAGDRNGQLMAAAPDLLAALKKCAAVCAGEAMNKNGLIDALESARAAIAKATGES